MKRLLFILFLIFFADLLSAQQSINLVGFPDAKQISEKILDAKIPYITSGVFTFKPRVETGEDGKDYFLVELYAVRFAPDNNPEESWWSYQDDLGTYDNTIGSFNVVFEQPVSADYGNLYANKFGTVEFILAEDFTEGLTSTLLCPVKLNGTLQFGLNNTFSFAYVCTSTSRGQKVKVVKTVERVPIHLGTLKCQILDPTKNSGFVIRNTCSAGVYSKEVQDLLNCNAHVVVGYLDESPDIPLRKEVPTTKPEDPTVPGGPTPLCAGTQGVYAISALPKNADQTVWKVMNGATEVGTDVAEVALGSDKKSATIKWKKNGTYQVQVWARNSVSNENSDNAGVLSVTINAAPAIALQRDGVLIASAAQKTICSGIDLNLSVNQISGVTYTWQGTGGTNAYKEKPVNKGKADITKEYKVTATQNGCTSRDSVTMTIYQEPDCIIDPTVTSYPVGSMLTRSLLCNNTSSPITTYNWTSPVTSTESSIDFKLPAGQTVVTVTATNGKGCSQTFTQTISDNGQGLEATLASVYGNVICQGGTALLKATVTKTVGDGPYTFTWYEGKDEVTRKKLATHSVNSLEDYMTLTSFPGTSNLYYSVEVTNSSMLSVTANSPALTVNTGKTAGTIITDSPLVAATPDKKVLLYATTLASGDFEWLWMPENQLDGGNGKKQYVMTQPVTGTTDYTVLMHDKASGGCLSSAKVEVRLPENNLAMTVSPANWNLCQNGSVQLNTTVSGGGSEAPIYKWTSLTTSNAPGSLTPNNVANPKYTASNDKSGTHEYLLRVARGAQVVTTLVTVEVKNTKAPKLQVNDVFCSDSNLLVANTGGVVTGSYKWLVKKPDNTVIAQTTTTTPVYPFAHDPGEYNVQVVAEVTGVCVSDTASRTGIEVKRPTVTQTVNPTVFPKGADVVSTATASNGWGNDYTYNWVVAGKSGVILPEQNKKSNIYKITGADEDSYSFNLTVKDTKGCEAKAAMQTATANLNGMDVQLALVNKYCQGGSVLLGATVTRGNPAYTYTWKKLDGTVLSSSTSPALTANYFIPAGQVESAYLLTVTDQTSPTPLTITKKITLTPESLALPVIATEGTIKIKPNIPAVLRAELVTPTSSPYKWQWSGNNLPEAEKTKQYAQTNVLPLSAVSETYQVYVIDSKGCISAPATEVVEVDDANGYTVGIVAENLNMCKNTRQILETTTSPLQTGAAYDWASIPENLFTAATKNLEKPEINPKAAGTYTIVVTVTNTSGVKNTARQDVTVKNATPPMLAWNYNSCQGELLKVTTSDALIANAYTWYVDGTEVIGNKTNQILMTDANAHTVRVKVAGANDCVADEQKTYTIKEQPVLAWDPEPTGIEVGIPFTAQVKATPEAGNYVYSWVKPTTGVAAGKTCTVTATASDKNIGFEVYAVDNTSGCKTNTLIRTVTVESNIITPNVFVLNNKVCTGGSAVMEVLSVDGADGPFYYEWKKQGSETVLGTGAKLVVSPVNAAVNYIVKVTKQTDARKTGSATVNLIPTAGSVPTLETFDLNVAPGNSATLVAKTNAVKPVWNWGPASRLASAAECSKTYPETVVFTQPGDSVYEVYVIDQGGCVSPKQNLTVHVQNDNVFKVTLSPDRELCIGNKETYTAQITGGIGSVVSATWIAGQPIAVTSDDQLQAVYSANASGLDTVAVVVNKGGMRASAKLPVKVRSGNAPTLKFAPVNPCVDSLLIVKADNGSALKDFNWKITKNGIALADVTTDRFKMDGAGLYTFRITATAANDCPANALINKEYTVYPNPAIARVAPDTDCDTTRLAAITTNADSWAWTKVSGITGATSAVRDSILVLPHVMNAMSAAYEYKVVAGSVHGCHSEPKSYNGTVYTLPAITMNPAKKNLYPNKDLVIEATMNPVLDYTLQWNEAGGNIAAQLSDTKIQTRKLAEGSYNFEFIVTNTVNTSCSKKAISLVNVTNADMKVELQGLGDTLEVCDGATYNFKALAENNMTDVTYKFEVKNPVGNTTTTPSADGMFSSVFNRMTGSDNRYLVRVTATDQENNSRKDSVVVKVNPNPTFKFKDDDAWGQEYALCGYKGKLEIPVVATGTAGWDVHYTIGGAQQTKHMAAAEDKLVITTGGEVVIDYIVDAKGCKTEMQDGYGFGVINDIPQFTVSASALNICQNTKTDLGIQITAKASDYPLYVFGRRNVTRVSDTLNTSAEVVAFDMGTAAPPRNYTFTVDSIRSARGCVFAPTTANKVTVSEYPESNPDLKLQVIDRMKEFCSGENVEIPVLITGGKEAYTIQYKVGSVPGTKVWTAADNKISVNTAGTFKITGFADGNGCGIFAANDTVLLKKYATPSMKINNTTTQMCGGQLDLDITLASGTVPYTIYYTKDGGAEQTKQISSLTVDKKAVWTITDAGNYVITRVEDAHCQIDGTAVTGGPVLNVTPLRLQVKMKSNTTICATAGAAVELDFTGTVWPDVKGSVRVGYEFTPAGSSTPQAKTADFTPVVAQANPKITPAPQGTYVLKSVVDLGANSCGGLLSSVVGENQITVIDAPVVTIDSVDFAARKGEAFVLGMKNPDGANFQYAWKLDDGEFVDAASPYSKNGVMNDEDQKYVLKGTNRTATSCFNTDTVNVFRIPDAPTLSIDTNNTRNDLVLHWNLPAGQVANGFTIKSVQWDAYGLAKQYEDETTMPSAASSFEIDQNDIARDTMKFFYIQAFRNVKRGAGVKQYWSQVSDTVGYYNLNILVNTNGNSSNNFFVTYFDLSKQKLNTAENLFNHWGIDNLSGIKKFDYDLQDWQVCVNFGGFIMDSFDVNQGDVLLLEATSPFKALQYGRLPNKYTFIVRSKNTEISNNNLFFMQPWRCDLKQAEEVFKEIGNISSVKTWDFVLQDWIISVDFGGFIMDSFPLRPILMPLMIEASQDLLDGTEWK